MPSPEAEEEGAGDLGAYKAQLPASPEDESLAIEHAKGPEREAYIPGNPGFKYRRLDLTKKKSFLAGRASLRSELPALIAEAVAKERARCLMLAEEAVASERSNGFASTPITIGLANLPRNILNPTPEVKSE